MAIRERFKKVWNAFTNEENSGKYHEMGASFGSRPDRIRYHFTSERTIISSIYTRLAIDTSSAAIRHVVVDDNNKYQRPVKGHLSECLDFEPNLDQGPTAFRQDIATTLFDKGEAVIVPVDTSDDPNESGTYDIYSIRVGEVVQWYPKKVKVSLYNEEKGRREDVTLDKSAVAVIANPLYSVMNETNSTLKRLVRKLNLLDAVDEATSSGKLDIIIQLPYVVKSDAMKKRAEERKKDIELQLRGGKYGIAYADGTEKITQLNRPAENNLLVQIKSLTDQLYAQLGLTPAVFDGTADEATMLNYHNRTIAPILDAITEAMTKSFLTKTARSQGQRVTYIRDPFKLVPISQIAEIADKFTRNEITTANEIRGIIGMSPSKDPKADLLQNSNMPQQIAPTGGPVIEGEVVDDETDEVDDEEVSLDETASLIDDILSELDGV